MSMLVRKGTMLHRNPSRRSSTRRSSRESLRKQRTRDCSGSGSIGAPPTTPREDESLGTDNGVPGLKVPGHHPRHDSFLGPHLSQNPGIENGEFSPRDSRRNSTCISQISGEERRELYKYSKFLYDSNGDYDSFMSQLKDAREDSKNGCEFAKQFYSIFLKTSIGTAFLLILSILALSMAFMGVKNLEECPLEPYLPIYFLVSGIFGLLKIIWIFYSQMNSRKYADFDFSFFEEDTSTSRCTLAVIDWTLNLILLTLFILGNVITQKLIGTNGQWPSPNPTLKQPLEWCTRGLFVFALAHLYFIYVIVLFIGLIWISLFTIRTIQIHVMSGKMTTTLQSTSSTRITRTDYV